MDKKLYFAIGVLFFQIILAQNNKFPIVAFQGIPPENTKFNDFLILKDAGFTVSLNMYENLEQVKTAIILGERANIKIIAGLPNLNNEPEIYVKSLKNENNLLGYYIEDEPPATRFDHLSKIVNRIEILDDKHIKYINLMPTYATENAYNADNYNSYIEQFITKVDSKLLSFDHYPITHNTIRADFYQNLEYIRLNAYKYKVPFWAFACTAIHYAYKEPTYSSIKLQQFSNLLYGAQALQYYTYWTVNNQHWIDNHYSYAIVDNKGNPTPTYNIVKAVNQQIQRLAWVFFGAKAKQIFHMGTEIPIGTTELKKSPKEFKYISTKGENALISIMTNGKNEFIIVQNKSLTENISLNYQLKMPLKKVNNNTGKTEHLYTAKKYTNTILPGDILIFANITK